MPAPLGKTPWVDTAYKRVWTRLQAQVPEDELPELLDPSQRADQGIRRALSVEEYGCGYFGCVSPTAEPEVVVKITTDESEAWFAYVAMGMAEQDGWPPGIVQYHRVLKLEGQQRRRRPVFLLWRSEAYDVGYLRGRLMWGQAPRDPEATLAANLMEWDRWSALLQHRILRSADPRALIVAAQGRQLQERAWTYIAERFNTVGDALALQADASVTRRQPEWDVARAVRACGVITEWMTNTYGSQEIGTALEYYLEQGLVPADLHLGNIGRAMHPEYGGLTPAIVDPGLALPVHPRWFGVRIPAELAIAA